MARVIHLVNWNKQYAACQAVYKSRIKHTENIEEVTCLLCQRIIKGENQSRPWPVEIYLQKRYENNQNSKAVTVA